MKLTYSGAGGGGGSGGNSWTKGLSQSAQEVYPILYSVLHLGQYIIYLSWCQIICWLQRVALHLLQLLRDRSSK